MIHRPLGRERPAPHMCVTASALCPTPLSCALCASHTPAAAAPSQGASGSRTAAADPESGARSLAPARLTAVALTMPFPASRQEPSALAAPSLAPPPRPASAPGAARPPHSASSAARPTRAARAS